MAINYASKYAQKIDEKFARESMTSAAVNNDYDFVGVKTVNVYSVPTAEMPEIDKYRFGKICEGAKTTVTGKVTKANAYDAFLTGATTLIENNVPLVGSCAFVSSDFYKNIKEDSSFIRNGDMSQEILIKGQVGTIDGIPLIVVPKSYFPENVEFIITNQAATTSPVKLSEYKIHDNPPGINGWLVEGRVYYDAFVLENKKSAIYVFKTAE